MTFDQVIAAVRRRWKAVVIVLLLSLAAAAAVTLQQRPEYTARSQIFVSTVGGSLSDLTQGSTFTQQLVSSYAAVATTPYVLDTVRRELGLRDSASTLAADVDVTVPSGTVLINVAATRRSAQEAAMVSNAVSTALVERVTNLVPESGARSALQLTIVARATVPEFATAPNIKLNMTIGVAAGLILGLAVAVLLDLTDTRVRRPADLDPLFKAPFAGAIPFDDSVQRDPLALEQNSRAATRREAFKAMRTNLGYITAAGGGNCVLVTSAIAGEGKSSTVVNLAIAEAELGRNVLLIDADLRRPRIAESLGIEGSVGLTDVLAGHLEYDECEQRWGGHQLAVLPAGHLVPNPSELLESEKMMNLIAAVRERFDLVLVDGAPVLPVTDSIALSRVTGGALVVVGIGLVRTHDVRALIERFNAAGANVLGYCANRVPASGRSGYAPYEYGYAQSEGN